MDAQRIVGIATAALLVLAVIGLVAVLWLVPDDAVEQPVVEAPRPKAPRPTGTVAPRDPVAGPMGRRSLPAPDRSDRTPPPAGTPTAHLSTEEWRDYNVAMHDVATNARERCVRPFAQENDLGTVEIVLDAVLWDGEVVDFGLRGLQQVPDHVLDCVAEVAWNTRFPVHDKPGELRLQRMLEVDGRRRATEDDIP